MAARLALLLAIPACSPPKSDDDTGGGSDRHGRHPRLQRADSDPRPRPTDTRPTAGAGSAGVRCSTTRRSSPRTPRLQRGRAVPHPRRHGSGLHLLWMLKSGVGSTLWSSTSTNGTDWTTPTAVSGLDGESYPSLIHDGTAFQMWVGSGSIAHATSQNGVDFTVTETVLRPGDAAFDTVSLSTPMPSRPVQASNSGHRVRRGAIRHRTGRLRRHGHRLHRRRSGRTRTAGTTRPSPCPRSSIMRDASTPGTAATTPSSPTLALAHRPSETTARGVCRCRSPTAAPGLLHQDPAVVPWGRLADGLRRDGRRRHLPPRIGDLGRLSGLRQIGRDLVGQGLVDPVRPGGRLRRCRSRPVPRRPCRPTA